MFTAMATESWGAPEAVQAAYLLEQRLDLLSSNEPVYLSRERGTGQRFWVKCDDGTAESIARLAQEKAVLAGFEHPHILPLKADMSSDDAHWLVFHWQGEQPLTESILSSLTQCDRVRLAMDLLDTVNNLHAGEKPIAHGHLELECLWVTPLTHWLRLCCFGHAMIAANEQDLSADRQAAAGLLTNILCVDEASTGLSSELNDAVSQWADGTPGASEQFQGLLKRMMLSCVTVDL